MLSHGKKTELRRVTNLRPVHVHVSKEQPTAISLDYHFIFLIIKKRIRRRILRREEGEKSEDVQQYMPEGNYTV